MLRKFHSVGLITVQFQTVKFKKCIFIISRSNTNLKYLNVTEQSSL